jgi:DNA-binding CsgD family transcriptional regulator
VITRAVLFEDFAGRSEELSFLLDLRVRSARESRGGTVIISGESGVGKTRLLREFRAAAAGERGGVAFVRCQEESAHPYGPLVEALQSIRQARELRATSSLDEALIALTTAGAIIVEDPAEQRLQRFTALRRAIEDAAKRLAHLTLIVDDAHASDLASLDALRGLTALAKRLPLTIVLAYRTESIETDLGRSRSLTAIEREGADRISLPPLPRHALARSLRSLLPNAAPATLQRICDLAEGKPYVAEELARSVVEHGDDARFVRAPLSLRSAVLERVGALDPASREIVRRAAVLGKIVRIDDLIAGGTEPGDVIVAIRAARDLQLIDERELAGEAAFAFRHAITREILYGDMPAFERRAMHLRIADRLERSDPARLAEIAYHLDAAGSTGRALEAGERAGDRAIELAAFADAVALYARALETIETTGTIGPDDLVRLAGKFLVALDGAGELSERYLLFEEICDRIERTGRHVDAFALRAQALMMFASYQSPRATSMLPAVSGRIPEGTPPGVRFDAAIAIMHALTLEYRFADASAALDEAISAVPDPDPVQAGKILIGKSILAYHWHGDHAAAEAYILETHVLAERTGNHKRVANCTKNLSVIAAARGQFREALRLVREASAAYARAGFVRWASKADGLAAMYSAQLADFAAAQRALASADSDLLGDREWIVARAHLTRAVGGTRAEFEAAFGDAVARHDTLLVRYLMPELAWSAPAKEIARALVRAAIDVSPDFDNDMDVADAIAAFGDPDDVAKIARHVAALELRDDQTFARAGRHLFEARLAAREHRTLAALGSARQAEALFRDMGLWAQRAHAMRLAGDVAAARAFLREIGATGELARFGEPSSPANGAPMFTQREEQVARLAARGHSNRDIAERLAISPRTVEAHIANVYEKLGIRSRSELAVRFG